MKGKKEFSEDQVYEIKKLISEKVNAAKNEQKVIRGNIRKIGFYYSDFRKNHIAGGYKVQDLNALIESGEIVIIKK